MSFRLGQGYWESSQGPTIRKCRWVLREGFPKQVLNTHREELKGFERTLSQLEVPDYVSYPMVSITITDRLYELGIEIEPVFELVIVRTYKQKNEK